MLRYQWCQLYRWSSNICVIWEFPLKQDETPMQGKILVMLGCVLPLCILRSQVGNATFLGLGAQWRPSDQMNHRKSVLSTAAPSLSTSGGFPGSPGNFQNKKPWRPWDFLLTLVVPGSALYSATLWIFLGIASSVSSDDLPHWTTGAFPGTRVGVSREFSPPEGHSPEGDLALSYSSLICGSMPRGPAKWLSNGPASITPETPSPPETLK